MLAVRQQPHRMGSTQPDDIDPFLPFGYAVDPNQQPLFDAPEPAPGAPLLSENDNRFLSSFFEDMTANQYNMPSFGEGLNFSDTWLDLPPQFMGTATSFGQHDGTPLASSGQQQDALQYPATDISRSTPMSHMMPPPIPPQPQQHQQQASEDVLNAAATLLQNGSASRSSSAQHHNNNPSLRRPPPVGHLRHQPLEDFREEGRRDTGDDEHDHTFNEWMYGSQVRRAPRNATPTDYHWGSDANFSPVQGYTPMSSKDTHESLSQEQLKCLDCFEVSNSTNTSRPNSPTNGQSSAAATNGRRSSTLPKKSDDFDAPPRKRRKSRNAKEAYREGDEEVDLLSKARKHRQNSSENVHEASPPGETASSSRRRKSAAANAAKAARENLTDKQKRENHIKSEQRRRTLIKDGFDDLCEIVPGLRGGGFSKSTMLVMAGEWLDDMLEGNEVLAAQLSSL